MKIIVGSKNVAKIAAVEKGAGAYWPQAAVSGEDVESGVSAQPIGLDETREGALNRARAAKALGGDLGVGLEGGVIKLGSDWMMFGFVAITDGSREVAVTTAGTPLPHAWGEAMAAGGELRPYVLAAGLPYDYKKGVVGLLTNDVVSRDDGFAGAVKTALAPWIKPEAYAA